MDDPNARPADFDWVTARHECSLRTAFEASAIQAERDLATRVALDSSSPTAYEFARDHGDRFSLYRRGPRVPGAFADRATIEFVLQEDHIRHVLDPFLYPAGRN